MTGPDRPRGAVVGFDGSGPSEHAVDWAAAEAARRGVPLTVGSAVDFSGVVGGRDRTTPWLSRGVAAVLDETVCRAAARAARVAPGIDVHTVTRTDGAAGMLVELSWSAELVVVGSRGHGDVAGAILGSVAFAVTAHARCPVAVVPGHAVPGSGGPVLVGVDGSAEAAAALHYAADLAAGLRAPLTVATVWRCTPAEAWALAYGGSDAGVTEEAPGLARHVNAAAVDCVRSAHPGLEVRPVVRVGVPGHVIADLGRDHALVVVGSRGHGGFAGLLLGSVSHAVIHQSRSPVVVVRPVAEKSPIRT